MARTAHLVFAGTKANAKKNQKSYLLPTLTRKNEKLNMRTAQYIDNINQRYLSGNATEHTFRGDLQQLIESLVPEIRATNEPKRQSCGAPDYILTQKDIPAGFIEAKDIGDKDVKGKKKSANKAQFDRYKASLNNLIFTDYIDFHLYNDGEFVTKIAILTSKGSMEYSEKMYWMPIDLKTWSR